MFSINSLLAWVRINHAKMMSWGVVLIMAQLSIVFIVLTTTMIRTQKHIVIETEKANLLAKQLLEQRTAIFHNHDLIKAAQQTILATQQLAVENQKLILGNQKADAEMNERQLAAEQQVLDNQKRYDELYAEMLKLLRVQTRPTTGPTSNTTGHVP